MSNSRKGITVKISNWIQTTLSKCINPNAEKKPLSYEEYRKTIQLGSMTALCKPLSQTAIDAPTTKRSRKVVDHVLYALTNGAYGVLDVDTEEDNAVTV